MGGNVTSITPGMSGKIIKNNAGMNSAHAACPLRVPSCAATPHLQRLTVLLQRRRVAFNGLPHHRQQALHGRSLVAYADRRTDVLHRSVHVSHPIYMPIARGGGGK